jgi:hypothetical protein
VTAVQLHARPLIASLVLALCSCAASNPPPGPGPGRRIPALSFETLDADRNAALSAEEFEALARAMFAQLDVNDDGALSKGEYDVLQARRRAGRPPGEGGGPRRSRQPRDLPRPY